jgi:hypothetical protein
VLDDCALPSAATASAAGSSTGELAEAAVTLIPRMLSVVAEYDSACAVLAAALAPAALAMPLYAFLPWIPQLFAMLQPRFAGGKGGGGGDGSRGGDSESSGAPAPAAAAAAPRTSSGRGAAEAAALLTLLAHEYPQAVYYPFRMSSASLAAMPPSAGGGAGGRSALVSLLAPLRRALNIPLLAAFTRALEDLQPPDMKYADWLKSARSLVTARSAGARGAPPPLPSEAQQALWCDLEERWHQGRVRAGAAPSCLSFPICSIGCGYQGWQKVVNW